MKIPAIFSFCLLVIVYGCNEPASLEHDYENDNETNCDPAQTTYTWSEDKEIIVISDTFNFGLPSDTITGYYSYVTDGGNIVFEYKYTSPDCDYIEDDKWGETLTFEINKYITEFEYTDSAIIAAKCVYNFSGFVINRGACQVKSGTISGMKISPLEWTISTSVIITYPSYPGIPDFTPKTIEFTGKFTKN